MKIAVLFGGASEEREVSVASAAQIIPALRSLGHEVLAIDTATGKLARSAEETRLTTQVVQPTESFPLAIPVAAVKTLTEDLRTVDLVFLALHGGAGEDGRIQAMLELAGVAYTGSNHTASALAMDKDLSKRIFRSVGVPTPDWVMMPTNMDEVERELGWPVVVKPNRQGSTVGISIVHGPDRLELALALARQYDEEVMVERYVAGREFTVAVLEGHALPVGEIITPAGFFDYESKYHPGVAKEIFPANLADPAAKLLQSQALRAHHGLKLGYYSRIDFRGDEAGNFWCLEANSLPGMTGSSLLPQAARAAGMDFADLVNRICMHPVGGRRKP